ncbi:MAG: hypothetical protein SV375_10985 [Thermodesulfobacteriota bacterium]|nr:hypothetical protein [Thermodesulfobacteriota bacterium]
MAERVAIVGVGQSEQRSNLPDVSIPEMINIAVRAALEDARLTMKEIEAVITTNIQLFEGVFLPDMWGVEGLGNFMKSGFLVHSGGTTGGTASMTAARQVSSGLFDTAISVSFAKMDEGSPQAGLRAITEDAFYPTNGITGQGAATMISRVAQYRMKHSRITEERAAKVRVKSSICASKNPNAQLRKVLSIEEVMNSRMLTWPVRLFHLCPTTSGACAIIYASEKKAKKITDKPVWVMCESTVHGTTTLVGGYQSPHYWGWAVSESGKRIYKKAGITDPTREIDVFEVYDMSTWNEIDWYERLQLCAEGESWKLIDENATALDGRIPFNPSGGVVSANTGAPSGMLRIAEAALQIRGDAGEHQVPKDVKTAFAAAVGGHGYCVSMLLKKSLT